MMRRRFRSPIGLDCNVTIEVRDAASGRLLRRERQHNLVTLAGRNLIRDFLNGTASSGTISHLAVGTGTAAPTANDTALGTEVFRDAVTKRTPDAGKLQVQYYLASTAANGSNLTEAMLTTAASGGLCFARVTFQAIAKTASITMTFTWDVNVNAG